MLFKHSYELNTNYKINTNNYTFNFYAYRDTKAGKEIFINYNGDNNDPYGLMRNKVNKQTLSFLKDRVCLFIFIDLKGLKYQHWLMKIKRMLS